MRREQALKQSISILTVLCALSLALRAGAQTPSAVSATSPTSVTSAREPASDPEHVRDLLTRGTEALSANRNQEARSLLTEAFRLRRSYDVAAALGQSELELGKHRDAAEHFEYAIREFPPGESRKLLKQLEDAFATAKAHVTTLHVSVNQPG
jgi:tetratricopeptide (TPR) repeat protein